MVQAPRFPPPCLRFNNLVATFRHHFCHFSPFFFMIFSHFLLPSKQFFLSDFLTHVSYLWPRFHNLISVYIFSNYFHPITTIVKVPRECFRMCDTCWISFRVQASNFDLWIQYFPHCYSMVIFSIYWWYFTAFFIYHIRHSDYCHYAQTDFKHIT